MCAKEMCLVMSDVNDEKIGERAFLEDATRASARLHNPTSSILVRPFTPTFTLDM